jgi:antitoxin component of MazEF toxin-antitoxin module
MIRIEKPVVRIGSSRAVILPKEWLDHHRDKNGREVERVEVHIGETILIRPLFDSEAKVPE